MMELGIYTSTSKQILKYKYGRSLGKKAEMRIDISDQARNIQS